VLEVRLKGMQTIAVTTHGDTIGHAVDKATKKMKTSLYTAC